MNFLQGKSPQLFHWLVISKQQVSRRLSPTVVIKFSRKSILSKRIISFHCSWKCPVMLICACLCCTSSWPVSRAAVWSCPWALGAGWQLWNQCQCLGQGVIYEGKSCQNSLIAPTINVSHRRAAFEISSWTSRSGAQMPLGAVFAMKKLVFVSYFCPEVCHIPQFPLLLTRGNNCGGNLVFVSAQPQSSGTLFIP